MKKQTFFTNLRARLSLCCLAAVLTLITELTHAQSCPNTITTNSVSTFPNSYYSGSSATLSAGDKSIVIGPVSFGSDPITAGDILLVIQMQGAYINFSNSSFYGNNLGSGTGYLNDGNLSAGLMEYVVAANSVPTTGGTLTLKNGLKYAYKNQAYNGSFGQYRYQIIRVPVYYRVKLTGTINVPAWNGVSGGVLVMYAVDSIIMNGNTINAQGAGFRGGGGKQFSGGTGTSGDYESMSTNPAHGSKGEGIGGSPRYMNYNDISLIDSGANEGYPFGSMAMGGAANAGGGGTDADPSGNDQNSGGGGGGNGGNGGKGGNSWSTNKATGGVGGTIFSQYSPARLTLGGGGGAGTTNNGTGTPGGGFASSGAAGGGLVILMANTISGTGVINANGADGMTTVANDGSGGGGAGGSVVVYSATGNLSNLTVLANGGNGGSNSGSGAKHGPGGGGGGGVIYANATINASSGSSAGNAGTTYQSSHYGAASGTSGIYKTNMTQSQMATFPLVCTILPMTFMTIDAQNQGGAVNVTWTVTNENNTHSYIIEKSVDGAPFTEIGSVDYQPNSTAVNHYGFTDNFVGKLDGGVSYRVKELDWFGNVIYSKIVAVKINTLSAAVSIYPNPVKNTATISFVASSAGQVNIRLFSLSGVLFWQTQYQTQAGANLFQLTSFASVPDGLYMLELSDGQAAPVTTKIIVSH